MTFNDYFLAVLLEVCRMTGLTIECSLLGISSALKESILLPTEYIYSKRLYFENLRKRVEVSWLNNLFGQFIRELKNDNFSNFFHFSTANLLPIRHLGSEAVSPKS